MNKYLKGLLVLVLGVGVGGGSAYGISFAMQDHNEAAGVATEFVPTDTILAPIVLPDGGLSGYVSFTVQLEVTQGEGEEVREKLPLFMNAINMRTYRTPMATGKDGRIPGLEVFRKVAMNAAKEVYGADVVRRVIIQQAAPA